jgi:hypothetical protein
MNEGRTMPRAGRSAPQIVFTDSASQAAADRAAWRALSPNERVDMVEQLRLQAGRFLYDYPCRLRRLLAIAGRTSR